MAGILQTTFSIFSRHKIMHCYSNFTEICSCGSIWLYIGIGSCNDLAQSRWQAITWISGDLNLWGHMVKLGHNEWSKVQIWVVFVTDLDINSKWHLKDDETRMITSRSLTENITKIINKIEIKQPNWISKTNIFLTKCQIMYSCIMNYPTIIDYNQIKGTFHKIFFHHNSNSTKNGF